MGFILSKKQFMKNIESIEIIHLTDEFYRKYPHSEYSEILFRKSGRGYYYGVLIVEIYSVIFAIPLHSNVTQGYKIREDKITGRYSGLDFEKAVVIEDKSFLGDKYQVKPSSDYNTILRKRNHIDKMFKKYVLTYIKSIKNNDTRVLNREYKNTTLRYFHHILLKEFSRYSLLNPLLTPCLIPEINKGDF